MYKNWKNLEKYLNKMKKLTKIYYLVSKSGQILEASPTAGGWEDRGISNIEVLKIAHGVSKRKVKVGYSLCTFKFKEL